MPSRLHRLIVEGLYGTFNHDITFDPGPVTILHGPNGVGKTTLLALLSILLSQQSPWSFKTEDLTRLTLELSDGTVVNILADGSGYRIGDKRIEQFDRDVYYVVNDSSDSFPNAVFLDTDRLIDLEPWFVAPKGVKRDAGVIDFVARWVAAALKSIVSSYGQRSAELSATYPHRLVERLSAPIPPADLSNKVEELHSFEARYPLALDILGISSTAALPADLNDTNQQVLGLYIEDNLAKLVAIEPGLASAQAFAEALLARRFVRKTIELSHKAGLVARARSGLPIPLDGLSPGEQHQLLFLYVLFLGGISAGTVLLIDEPEISLHPHWQERWMIDLVSAAKLHGFQAVVATHSPYIVGEFADSLRRLDGDD